MIQNNQQNRVLRIGLTGGIASGKSTVSSFLKKKGAYIIDADIVSREIVTPPSLVLCQLQETFGDDIVLACGELNRKKLAEHIFNNEKARHQLNSIMFPAIWERIDQLVVEYQQQEQIEKSLFIDAALLLESGGLSHVDALWLVACDEEQQLQRLMRRDHLSYEEAKRRQATQWPLKKKEAFADVILDNSGDEQMLFKQVEQALDRLKGSEKYFG